ncbi:MAG: NAD(P)/FAD-dependent oxidoreductase [Thermoplasmatales archaeon]|nr:NAD(P)/FAD-dependent oxidoreductase [Thermoplasmatales archaeon]
MPKDYYKVVIIGAGPAGLFAASELAESGIEDVLVIEKGKDAEKRKCPVRQYTRCMKCKPCNILCGVGGAGCLSDGKLNLRADIGGNLNEFTDKPDELIKKIDEIFLKHGCPKKIYGKNLKDLEKISSQYGIHFIPIPQRHIGSDRLPSVISSFKREIEEKGISFYLEREVKEIENNKNFILHLDGEEIECSYLLVAVGRSGAEWLSLQANKLGIKTRYAPLDLGVRVEVPSVVMEDVVKKAWDPKFHIYTPTYDDFIRTFCTCPNGFVVMEDYGKYISVNGHSSINEKSQNTNFAFLVRISLTQPVENTTAYGTAIASMATVIGGRKPILQRLGDLKSGRRSTWERIGKSYVEPTLRDATPGDISMALPHRIVTDVIEGLDKLAKVIPGVAEDSTLLYAPEIKFYSMRFVVDKNMETNLKNFFVAGDGAGLSRGIVSSAATGILAARGIIEKLKG